MSIAHATLPSLETHITILRGASVQGSLNYEPDTLTINRGDRITVTNNDNIPHTVTSGTGPQDTNSPKSFDTSIIEAGASTDISTANLGSGN